MSRLERWYICLSCESFYPERLRLHHALAGQKETGGLAVWSPIYLDREKMGDVERSRTVYVCACGMQVGSYRNRGEQCTYARVECRLVAIGIEALPSVGLFAECLLSGTRQRRLCREPHSIKLGSRQRVSLPSAGHSA
jgi:hypothetical protein